MTVIKRFLRRIRENYKDADEKTKEYLEDSERWHERLVQVANSFAPLYRKGLKNDKHTCNVGKEIENSIRLISSKKSARDILFIFDNSCNVRAGLYAGELQTVLVNLFDNATYWIQYSEKKDKRIQIRVQETDEKHIKVIVSDTGTGILKDDAERIFQPGITAKTNGIGMGLVIITEILHSYDCKIATVIPGELGGATFEFELPKE